MRPCVSHKSDPGLRRWRTSKDAPWRISLQNLQILTILVSPLLLCRLLIQTGYDVNIKDYDGWTPLHAASHWGKEEACRILVENLCDMDIINKMVRNWKMSQVIKCCAIYILDHFNFFYFFPSGPDSFWRSRWRCSGIFRRTTKETKSGKSVLLIVRVVTVHKCSVHTPV